MYRCQHVLLQVLVLQAAPWLGLKIQVVLSHRIWMVRRLDGSISREGSIAVTDNLVGLSEN